VKIPGKIFLECLVYIIINDIILASKRHWLTQLKSLCLLYLTPTEWRTISPHTCCRWSLKDFRFLRKQMEVELLNKQFKWKIFIQQKFSLSKSERIFSWVKSAWNFHDVWGLKIVECIDFLAGCNKNVYFPY
jgi:hypothetical protein